MKVGIFGDSFATRTPINNSLSWCHYVQENDPTLDIWNYAIGGSSIYFTYQNFIKHHNKFDKVIVCATDANRLWLPNTVKEWDVIHTSTVAHFNGLDMCPEEIANAIKGYYAHIVNVDQQKDLRLLQVAHMLQLRPDMLYFDCFVQDRRDRLAHDNPIGPRYMALDKISNLAPGGEIPTPETRCNHMSKENNIILAAKITNWINTSEFEMNITDFQKEEIK